MLESFKKKCRAHLIKRLAASMSSEDVMDALRQVSPVCSRPRFSLESNPYFDQQKTDSSTVSQRDDIVFVTGRFRSGSTLLWNIFRSSEYFTSYYEPFNERKWFDRNARGAKVDATHLGVDDYSREYNNLEFLERYYDETWIRYHLHMDENSYDYKMKRYIELLVDHAPKRPVLQFNRIDFRLGWLKKNFNNSKLIHIYRHPRDQWCSFLVDLNSYPSDGSQEFNDHFYLNMWCRDLQKQFPFLSKSVAAHPYQRFYLLWRLSYIFGKKYADLSLSLEGLSAKPEENIRAIFDLLGSESGVNDKLVSIVKPVGTGKWKKYAGDEWFAKHEVFCEGLLKEYCRDVL